MVAKTDKKTSRQPSKGTPKKAAAQVELKTAWLNRIAGTGELDPAKIKLNPKNYIVHTDFQEQLLEEVLDKVGYVTEVIVNKRSGNLVDGELRVLLARKKKQKTIPVKYVDLSLAEEELVLATLDPIRNYVKMIGKKVIDLAERQRTAKGSALDILMNDLKKKGQDSILLEKMSAIRAKGKQAAAALASTKDELEDDNGRIFTISFFPIQEKEVKAAIRKAKKKFKVDTTPEAAFHILMEFNNANK